RARGRYAPLFSKIVECFPPRPKRVGTGARAFVASCSIGGRLQEPRPVGGRSSPSSNADSRRSRTNEGASPRNSIVWLGRGFEARCAVRNAHVGEISRLYVSISFDPSRSHSRT